MHGAIAPFTQTVFELFGHNLTGTPDEAEVLSNATYGIGLVIEHSSVDLSHQFLPVLQAIRPMFDTKPDSPHSIMSCKDNACGALSRMMVRNLEAMPLDQVLPVFMQAIPCEADVQENKAVFSAIFHIYRNNQQVLAPYVDQLLSVFAKVLNPNGPELITAETRAEVIGLIGVLNQQDPAKIQAAGLAAFI
jgi:importin-4